MIAGDAAVPGVGGVEPAAEPDLDERHVQPGLGELAEHDRGQQLELGRLAEAAGDPVGRRQRPRSTSRAKSPASIGRPSTTIRSRYVTRCGLGVSPTR